MKVEAGIHRAVISFQKFTLNHRKKIHKAFAGLLTIIGLFSALPLFSDRWRDIFLDYCRRVTTSFPVFISFFYDPRAFILYIILILVWIKLIYYKHEVQFLELALEYKRELSAELPGIKNAKPKNHYLGIIIGKLNEKALNVKDQYGAKIISAIDKNIKKHERVYWISEDEIGIIFYEDVKKNETDFITYVIKAKLKNELEEHQANLFLDNIRFAMAKIEENDDLKQIESKARAQLLKGQVSEGQVPIATPLAQK